MLAHPLSLWQFMKAFKSDMFLHFSNLAGIYEAALQAEDGNDLPVPQNVRVSMIDTITLFRVDCKWLGLGASAATCLKLLGVLNSPPSIRREVSKLYVELQGRLVDEMADTLLLSIEPGLIDYFKGPDLFGEDVTKRFPNAITEIEEAGKCLALSRNTACAFHCMRAVEHGLRALAASLNDPELNPDLNPTWDRVLGRGDRELLKTYDKRSPEWRAKDAFFSDALANLRAVKNAWRNPTMHVKSGLYDDAKARDVFNATAGFMRHLATEIGEPGQ